MILFNNAISHVTLNKIVEHIRLDTYPARHRFDLNDEYLYLVKKGTVDVIAEHRLESISTGDFFGETSMFFSDIRYPNVQTSEPSEIYRIPTEVLKYIPIVNWKLFERHEKRRKLYAPKLTG